MPEGSVSLLEVTTSPAGENNNAHAICVGGPDRYLE
jgi:hypothetical protein